MGAHSFYTSLTTELQCDAWMDRPRNELWNSINSKHNLPTQPNQTSQFMIIRTFSQRDNVHKGLNLLYHCSLPEFCSDVEYSWVRLGQASFMSQEQRPAAIAFCFHSVWAHHFLLLLLFSLLFQTLLFFLPLPLPVFDILGGWSRGMKPSRYLGKEWPKLWAVTVLTAACCTGIHKSYTNSCETYLSSQSLAPSSFTELHFSSLLVRKGSQGNELLLWWGR